MMNPAPLFTVVVSAHQTEPWLPKALASVAGQSFPDFECILYVEESTDASLAIARAAADRAPRFSVVSAPKSGACATTRNYAIDHARGRYLVILDGDDWLAPDALARLAEKLDATGPVDVLAFAALATPDENAPPERTERLANFSPADASSVVSGPDALRRAVRGGAQFRNFVWLSAYRLDFLRATGLRQSDGVLMEDLGWTPRVWFAADRVACLDAVLYTYRRRPGSLTTEASPRILFDLVVQIRSLLDFVFSRPVPPDLLAVWANQWMANLYWFLFHPVTSRKIPDSDRRQALRRLFAPPGGEQLRRLAARASLPRRLAFPLLRLAALGVQFPAKLFFRRLYYPLVARRSSR